MRDFIIHIYLCKFQMSFHYTHKKKKESRWVRKKMSPGRWTRKKYYCYGQAQATLKVRQHRSMGD